MSLLLISPLPPRRGDGARIGSLAFPRNGVYQNNVIVWTGSGPYPAKVPAGVRVLSGRVGLGHWATVVADWERRHRC